MVDKVDAVMVALPHDLHYECGVFFARNKKHIFMEKPLANTEEECVRLIDICEEEGVTLMCGYPMRYIPGLVKLKELSDVTFNSAQIIPSWIPEGFSVHDYSVSGNANSFNLSALFLSGERTIRYSAIITLSKDQINYHKDESNVEIFDYNGISHYYIANCGEITSIWVNDGVECSISGDISTDELKKIIISIYERTE